MLFGTGSRLSGLFATHPPLSERIRALDPSFKESDYPVVSQFKRDLQNAVDEDQRHVGLAAAAGALAPSFPEAEWPGKAKDLGSTDRLIADWGWQTST